MPRSHRSVINDRISTSQRSYNEKRRERPSYNEPSNGVQDGCQPDRERRDKRSHDRLSSQESVRGQYSRPPTIASGRQSRHSKASISHHHPPKFNPYLEKRTFSEKCSNLCSIRGILKFVEIAASILVLICVVASYAVVSGYTSAAGFSSFSINSAYSPFEGTELQQVRDADMQYSQLRAPGVYGGVAVSVLLCALTIVFLILGAKSIHKVSIRVLFAELIFDAVASVGYLVAVSLYLYFIKQVNDTDICKTRQRLYAGRGYTWMNCETQGGDAAVAIFGLIAACVYLPSAILCFLYIRTVRDFRKNYLPYDNQRRLNKSQGLDCEDTLFHPSTLV
ncbi:MARVEL domain-containing protein 3-like [Mixophyes fleayi]|uniref:MARVEL domain-containing protein 3-like n=1 Tax=Mixophyes fleayi TaxID=3061075 RepID=UPI003F4E29B5